mmetsp:Transcript_26779/g.41646  ORF Transcript_26779/g.41646 Transcript_26779/m.41646 type:complete len:400 (-) Transcript_26779:14-1213(-)
MGGSPETTARVINVSLSEDEDEEDDLPACENEPHEPTAEDASNIPLQVQAESVSNGHSDAAAQETSTVRRRKRRRLEDGKQRRPEDGRRCERNPDRSRESEERRARVEEEDRRKLEEDRRKQEDEHRRKTEEEDRRAKEEEDRRRRRDDDKKLERRNDREGDRELIVVKDVSKQHRKESRKRKHGRAEDVAADAKGHPTTGGHSSQPSRKDLQNGGAVLKRTSSDEGENKLDYKALLKQLYKKHAPQKIADIPRILGKGDEAKVYERICRKYEVDPQSPGNAKLSSTPRPSQSSNADNSANSHVAGLPPERLVSNSKAGDEELLRRFDGLRKTREALKKDGRAESGRRHASNGKDRSDRSRSRRHGSSRHAEQTDHSQLMHRFQSLKTDLSWRSPCRCI